MSGAAELIVPDATPLVTLAAADRLDLLLKPQLPVVIPDGVEWETTRYPDKLGASAVADWLKANASAVRIAPTNEFSIYSKLIEQGIKRIPNLGERCALEVVNDVITRDPARRAILIYEDSDVPGLIVLKADMVSTLTTAEFLDGLEDAGMIPSADEVLDSAVKAGRNAAVHHRSAKNAMYRAFQQRGGFQR